MRRGRSCLTSSAIAERRHGAACRRGLSLALALGLGLGSAGCARTSPPASANRPPLSTEVWVDVASGPVADVFKRRGTVVPLETEVLLAGAGGVVTSVASRDAIVEPGAPVARVDEGPIILLPGAVPAFRRLGLPSPSAPIAPEVAAPPTRTPLQSGADVRQLEAFLADRGLDPGVVDGVFDVRTSRAVGRLRQRVGLSPGEGSLEFGDYLFVGVPGPWRVTDVLVGRGGRVAAGSPLVEVAGPRLGIRVASSPIGQGTVTFTAGGVTWRLGADQTQSSADQNPPAAEEGGAPLGPVAEEVLLEPESGTGSVALGQDVTVEVRRAVSNDAVAVPVGAVRRSASGTTFVWCGDRRATRQCPVTLGELVGDRVIVEGLPAPTSVRVGGG